MLVEVLVASTILLMVFTGVVTQVGNLAQARLQIETRDRAVAYVNSLHEIMGASGCGFDVDTVDEKIFTDESGNPLDPSSDAFSGSDQVSLRGPWDRVQACAFAALERAREDTGTRVNSYVDDNGNVHLTVSDIGEVSSSKIDKETAKKFCDEYGDENSHFTSQSCELGDQTFSHPVTVNDDGVRAIFNVSISYWFEKVGSTSGASSVALNNKSTCNEIVSSGVLPDTLARRVQVSFPRGDGATETMTVTKRESVPADSLQFATGTRVGIVVPAGNVTTMYPNPTSSDPWKVTRTRNAPTSCIWFPYITAHQAGDEQPAFSVDGSGTSEATLSEIPALGSGVL